MRSEFKNNIAGVRSIEDAIRATRRYTEGLNTIIQHHPVQGTSVSSRAFAKCYEIYPDMVIGMDIDISDLPVSDVIDWLWADTTCVNVRFWYDYRVNQATFKVIGGDESLQRLLKVIPGLLKLLLDMTPDRKEQEELVALSKTVVMPETEPEEINTDEPKNGFLGRLLPSKKKT